MKTLIMIMTCLWVNPGIADDHNFDVNISEFSCEEIKMAYQVNNEILKVYKNNYEECMIHAMNDGFNEMFCAYVNLHTKLNKDSMQDLLTEYMFRCSGESKINI